MRYRRRSFVLIVLGTLLVTVPLLLAGQRAVTDSIVRNKTTSVVEAWLSGPTDQILAVGVDGSQITVSVEGAEQSRSVDELAAKLEATLGHPVTVTLRVIPAKVEVSQSRSSP